MKKIFTLWILPLFILTGCANFPEIKIPELDIQSGDTKKPLNTVELKHPNVTFIFPSGETYRSGDVFTPPKTVDCSKLTLKPDSFEDAIEAGALVVRIQTPTKVTHITKNKEGKEIKEVVSIKPVYGGVLALCNVSDRATGPDSRSYRIRGLNDYLVKGKEGFVSVVGAVLSGYISRDFSWMLWLTDRTATFTDYEAEVSRRRVSSAPE